jgi:glutamate--cysteine ligase
MPSPTRQLTREGARNEIIERSFGAPDRGLVGIELEWHLFLPDDPTAHVEPDVIEAISPDGSELAGGGRVTHEPGGQVEVSTAPAEGLAAAVAATTDDLRDLVGRARSHGVVLAGGGIDPFRTPRRLSQHPRYVAMEKYFDAWGSAAGRQIMGGCASIQVNVDAGDGDKANERWELLHDVGPALVAAFACSPIESGAVTDCASSRMRTWWQLDPSRTHSARRSGAGLDAWIDFVFGADVMFIRRTADCYEPILSDLTFARWLDEGHELGFPTVDDLQYHLTTLFPPVRVRGHFEVRYIDELPDPWWRVAAAVVVALATDGDAGALAREAVRGTVSGWEQAMRDGLRDPALAAAADGCFTAASDALGRMGAPADLRALVDDYRERYVDRRRMPGDDVLDAHRAGQPLLDVLGIAEVA